MTKYNKIGLIAGQIFIGFGFAIMGAIAASIIVGIYSFIFSKHIDPYGGIMYAVIGGYLGMQAGIGFEGFTFLKHHGRQKDFPKFFALSMLGTLVGLITFYFVLGKLADDTAHVLVNLLAGLLPLTGAVIGFNYQLLK